MVPGEGPQPALGMIVGEAPGREEIEKGRPFVGRSGKLLETALRAVGLTRDEVYITNIVKDLPLDSDEKIRRPTPEEIEAWRPILEGEIENVAPFAILALGRTAANTLCGLEGEIPFGSKVGNVYVAWHPAYVVRQGYGGRALEHWTASDHSLDTYEDWLMQIRPWAEAIHAA
jgi:uracil-DNA glycosylase family 4